MTETPISILNMPDVVLTMIFEECDFVAIQCLRKTCHSIRRFIDDAKPQQDIDILRIYIHNNKIRIGIVGKKSCRHYPSGQKVDLCFKTKNENTQIRKNGEQVKTIKNENYLNAASRDLKTILVCKLPILSEFSVEFIRKTFLKNLCTSLKSRRIPLQVKTFSMHRLTHQNQILQILPYIYPNSLEKLDFLLTTRSTVNIDKIIEMEHWRKAKELCLVGVNRTAGYQNFAHFEVATVFFYEVTLEDLMYLKTIFIDSLSTSKHFLLYYDRCPGEGELINSFGNPIQNYEERQRTWFSKRPNNKEFVVYFGQHSYYNPKFEFKLIRKENVPKNAIIYD